LDGGMAWLLPSKRDQRRAVSREHLERTITDAVKSECDGFVGVVIERVKPRSRAEPNWALRGARFGKADREKSHQALATHVERLQREFTLAEDENRHTLPKPIVSRIPID
jgi:hypothetical protein